MSYARFGPESDVYVFLHVGGYLECCACGLSSPDDDEDEESSYFPRFYTTAEMIDHLAEHARAGHDVPDYCVGRLIEDAIETDRWIADFGARRRG